MLYEAATWRPGPARPPFEDVFSNPRIAGYVEGWGRPGDYGVIAEADDGTPVGAAWYRSFTEAEHGLGFVAPAVPEVAVGVSTGARGRGVGTRLLAALIAHARETRTPALSLSVEEDNAAARLYERLGFARVARVGNAWTMRLDL